jgi:hypothetical protein
MKYLKRYNEVNSFLKNKNLLKLTNEELVSYEYIIGNNLNESFSDILGRLKKIAEKTALTTALMSALMSNPTFSKEYNELSDPEKKEIESLVRTSDKVVTGDKISSSIDVGFEDVKFGGLFKSGVYELERDSDLSEMDKLVKFVKNNPGKKFVVKISASESRVPNKDKKTGKSMKVMELAEKRFESTKKFIQDNLGAEVSFIKDIKVGGPKYIGDDIEQDKYKENQYVNATISLDIWNFSDDFVGSHALKKDGYIGKSYKFLTEDAKGTGKLSLSTGRIPDRAKVFVDGVVVGDTGYFSDVKPEVGYKLVPLYVLELTKAYKDSPETEAFKGIKPIKIKDPIELEKIILDPKIKPVSKFDRAELETAYDNLVAYVKESIEKDGYVNLVIYDDVKKDIELKIDNENSLKIEVYSPIGKTGFTISVKMDGEREQRFYNTQYSLSDKSKSDKDIKFY